MPMAMKLFGQDLPGGAKHMLVSFWKTLSLAHKYQLLKSNASIRHKEQKPPNNSIIAPLASIDHSTTANVSFSPIINNKLFEYKLDAFIADG
eukprot:3367645-Pleurochrysis_carterae.AAC.1